MNATTFVDTNVLIYAYNVDAHVKYEIAKGLLQQLWTRRTGVLSLQVLQEFYVNVTRKIPSPLSKESARAAVNTYLPWCTETTPAEIAAAFQIEDESRISFWDALIVACAAKAGADLLFSEDFSAGQRIAGVLIENPFAPVR